MEITMGDLFGATVKSRRDLAKGYAGRVGAGPVGETCGTCRNIIIRMAAYGAPRRVSCDMAHHDNFGPSSAVKPTAAACQFWERQEEETGDRLDGRQHREVPDV